MLQPLTVAGFLLAAASIAHAEWRGPVVVKRVPQADIYQHCPRGTGLGIVRGCAYGGVKHFGGVRGRCVIIISDQAAPYVLDHEIAHCDGWNH